MEIKICREDIANPNDIELLNHLECAIDMSISLNPVICLKCENIFCQDCVDQWKKKSNTCPMRCEPFDYKEVKNTLYASQLKKIRLFCAFQKNGCIETPLNEEKKDHEIDCYYRPINCNQCKVNGIPKILYEEHLYINCNSFKIKCLICKEDKSVNEFIKHFINCYNISFPCEYCFHRIYPLNKSDLDNHNENCIMKVKNCKKCKYLINQKNLEEIHNHSENNNNINYNEMKSKKNLFYNLLFIFILYI
jgi:hypothetical protein